MTFRRHLRTIALAAGAILLAGLPASADIKSFNAAMQKGDYKAAAAAAASAWPTLDKSREDLAIIAREFGFAAYLSGDFAAARTYGEAAVAASDALGEEPVLRTGSELLLRLAEHRIKPGVDTRDKLFAALQARAADPTIDLITYFSAEAATTYDFEEGRWKEARASAELGAAITSRGGDDYSINNLRFALLAAASRYMADRNIDAHKALGELQRDIIKVAAAAPAGRDFTELHEVYRETSAWVETTNSHLKGLRRLRDEKASEAAWEAFRESAEYKTAMNRFTPPQPEGVCRATLSKRSPIPNYPSSARFRGMVGTIVLSMDLDNAGKPSNAKVIAAVPIKYFGDAVLKDAHKFRFEPAEGSAPGCTLAQTGYVLTVVFEIRG